MRTVADSTIRSAFHGLHSLDSNDHWQSYRHRFATNAPDSYAQQLEALASSSLDLSLLHSLGIPGVVLTGRHDAIWGPACGQTVAERLGVPFEVVDGAAHLPPLQNPAAVESVIRRLAGSRLGS